MAVKKVEVEEICESWQDDLMKWWGNDLQKTKVGLDEIDSSPYRSFTANSEHGIEREIVTGEELLTYKTKIWKIPIGNILDLFLFQLMFPFARPYMQYDCYADLDKAVWENFNINYISNANNNSGRRDIICDLRIFGLGKYKFSNWIDYLKTIPEELKYTEDPLAEYTQKPIEALIKNTYVNF